MSDRPEKHDAPTPGNHDPINPVPVSPVTRLPQITALSIAFPLCFEPAPARPHPANTPVTRPPHRHDAGE